MSLEAKLKIGAGIYTAPDIAKILNLPLSKVNRWITDYWDARLGKVAGGTYSWSVDDSRAIDFHTLIELYVLTLFEGAGVNTKKVLVAHTELSKIFDTPYPFANRAILSSMKTDGRFIFFKTAFGIISLDGKKQFQFDFVEMLFKKLSFDDEILAKRFFPMGKNKQIIIDPERQFGQPVVGNTNIYPETIYNLYKAGEPVTFISHIYELDEKQVQDAIDYCMAA